MIVTASGLTAGYHGRDPVFADAEFRLGQGARGVLLGPNGAGKTTLLRCLSGAHKPSAGVVALAGKPVRYDRKGLRAHRARVQLVLQDPDDQLFSADVRQDVAFGPLNMGLAPADAEARVGEALAALRIAHLADRPTHQLSYGERKRVAIAGAVAMRPEVLLLDEPTAGVDPAGEKLLVQALLALWDAGTTLLVSTHDVDLALELGTEATVVVGGRIHQGKPADLLGDEQLLEQARLQLPWAVAVGNAMGWADPPTTKAAVVERLARRSRSAPEAKS